MKFCNSCGNPLIIAIPAGDDRQRHICGSCGAIHYQNPKMVVGCIVESGDRILLCRRAIEPRYGKWTIPAGFLENMESVSEGARRETFEEANARLGELTPYRLFSIRGISQMYMIFRGNLNGNKFGAGDESLDVRLFPREEIPWDELAFRVVSTCLGEYFRDRETGVFTFQVGEIPPDEK